MVISSQSASCAHAVHVLKDAVLRCGHEGEPYRDGPLEMGGRHLILLLPEVNLPQAIPAQIRSALTSSPKDSHHSMSTGERARQYAVSTSAHLVRLLRLLQRRRSYLLTEVRIMHLIP